MVIATATIMIITTIAIPKYRTRQSHVRVTAAISTIRRIQVVQVQYRSQYGRYARSLGELVVANLIDDDLAQGTKQGYRFAVTACADGYVVEAKPVAQTDDSDQHLVVPVNCGPEYPGNRYVDPPPPDSKRGHRS
jgi:Tfp pilus assembly protein PilE